MCELFIFCNMCDILNRARTGDLTDADKAILETRRLQPKRHKKIIDEALHVFWTNDEVEEMNLKKLNQLPSPLEVIEAKVISIKGYDPPENKHGKIDDTPFMKLLKLTRRKLRKGKPKI